MQIEDASVSDDNFIVLYDRRDPAVTGIDVYATWATSLLAETWKVGDDGMTESSMGWSNEEEPVYVELPLNDTNAFVRIQAEEQ